MIKLGENLDSGREANTPPEVGREHNPDIEKKYEELFFDGAKDTDGETNASESGNKLIPFEEDTNGIDVLEQYKLEENSVGRDMEPEKISYEELIKDLDKLLDEEDLKNKFDNVQDEAIAKSDAATTEGKEDSATEEKDEGEKNVNESEDFSEADENNEEKNLSEDEINEMQKEAIKEAFERIKNGEHLTNEELGNLGEMMMDQYYISKGYKPLNEHRVTCLDDKKGGFKQGIDGVYEKANPDGSKSYVIADAKYNTSQLSETNDGRQMSDAWIDKRLDDAVGKEKADEIRDAAEDDPNSVKHEVYHIDPNKDENGNTHTDTQEVDSHGNKTGEKANVEYFDEDGNRIESSLEE